MHADSLDFDCVAPAAPWYVYNTLLRSPRRVDDPNDADIIFVYDYCRLMWVLPFAPPPASACAVHVDLQCLL